MVVGGGKYVEKEIIRFVVEKNTEKEKESNIWRRKINIFAEGKKTEKEKEENIWRRRICLLRRRMRTEREKQENIWRRKTYIFMEGGKKGKGKNWRRKV